MPRKKSDRKHTQLKSGQKKIDFVVKSRNNKIVPLSIVIVGFILNIVAFWPGFMTQDSWFQYLQAKSGDYQDGHPPIMALLWSLLLNFASGPSGMLITQLSFFWMALYLVWEKFRNKPNAFLITLIGTFPWIVSISGVVWKDLQMTFSLILAIGLIIGKKTKIRIIAVLLLLFYAYSVRKNAPLAVAPIILYAIVSWWDMKRSRIAALFALTIVGFSAFGNILNYSILDATRSNIQNASYIDDLSYLSLEQKRSLIPHISYADIVSCKEDTVAGSNLIGKEGCLLTRPSYQDYLRIKPDLQEHWIKGIFANPKGYIQLHANVFTYQLIKPSSPPYGYWVTPGVIPDAIEIKQSDNFVTKQIKGTVDFCINNFQWVFKPLFWLGVLLWITYPVRYIKDSKARSLMQAIIFSGILYTLGYFIIGGSADYRYFYWPVLAANLSIVLLVVHKKDLVLPTEFDKIKFGVAALLIGITLLTLPNLIAFL
jgi:hypothetical protein